MSDWAPIRDQIKERVRLSEIVGRKVQWDRRKSQPGRGEFWACCPFHNEKSASFHVLDREGYYKCFGCGAGGDVVNFVMETDNRSYREAMEMLAEEAGIELPKPTQQEREQAQARASLHEVLERAAVFFEESLRLSGGEMARAYLKRRGLPAEAWKEFRLGYWPEGGHALIDHLKQFNIDHAQMRAAGLLSSREEPLDLIRGRVIFPITDGRGRVIGFGGRALREDQQPKYLNSPDTELFHKGRVLYNFAQARGRVANSKPLPAPPSLREGAGGGLDAPRAAIPHPNPPPEGEGIKRMRGRLIVAEGYMDVIALSRAGFARAVAPLGTALTEDQLALLWSVEAEPVICFDGDKAGLAAAGRALDRAMPLLKPGRTLDFAFLPPGQDPDDLIKAEGAAAMAQVLAAARPLSQAYWDFTVERCDLSTPDGRAHAEAELREGIKRIADPSVRRHYEAFIRGRIAAWFAPNRSQKSEFRNQKRNPGSDFRFPSAGPARPTSELRARRGRSTGTSAQARMTEEIFVLSLLTHPQAVHDLLEEIGAVKLAAPALEALQREIIRYVAGDPSAEPDGLIEALDAAGLGSEACRLIARQGLRCMPSAHPASPPEAVSAGLKDLIASLAARAEASDAKGQIKAALDGGLSEEGWAEARKLHVAAQRHSGKA